MEIDKNAPVTDYELQEFLNQVVFNLPDGFLAFFKEANGANVYSDEGYMLLWPLTDMVRFNKEYSVDKYAPNFFIFGSNGGDTAYAVEKSTGYIFEMPFIGMSDEESVFKCQTFTELLSSI